LLLFKPISKVINPLGHFIVSFSCYPVVSLSIPEIALDSSSIEEPSIHDFDAVFSMESTAEFNLDYAIGVGTEHFHFLNRSNAALNLAPQLYLELFEEILYISSCLLQLFLGVHVLKHYYLQSHVMQLVIFPSELSLLLLLNPQLPNLIKLLLLPWNVIAFLLELCLTHCDHIAWSELLLVEHLYSHINTLDLCITYPSISLWNSLIISVNPDLILSCDRVKSDDSASHKVLFQFILCNIIRQSCYVDEGIELCVVPLLPFVL
jgi:hypothetical protein